MFVFVAFARIVAVILGAYQLGQSTCLEGGETSGSASRSVMPVDDWLTFSACKVRLSLRLQPVVSAVTCRTRRTTDSGA